MSQGEDRRVRMRWLLSVATIVALACAFSHRARAESPITVFAAASLKAPLTALAATWQQQGHATLRLSFASSGTLAHQIEQGADAPIFISADEKWMDYLQRAKLLAPVDRADLLTNSLVLVAPAGQGHAVTLTQGFDLAAILGPSGRLAIGNPGSVPAGIYGKQALTRLGVWPTAQSRLAPAADVKAALLLVETGNAPAGIVYATDAKGDSKVHVIGVFPPTSHDAITYPIALIAGLADTHAARPVLDFLKSPAAVAVFTRFGFGTP
jgi:molybdate transport system substrate-binding protein